MPNPCNPLDCPNYAAGWCEYDFPTGRLMPNHEYCPLKEAHTMQELTLIPFIQDVHRNAVAHGWWDEKRSPGTIRSLIHCELSEAMEAYRKGEPLFWHECPYHPGACETQQPQDEHLHCEACSLSNRKPEGIAVELMDAVIRIFDYLGKLEHEIPAEMTTAHGLCHEALNDFLDDEGRSVPELALPDLVDILHDEIGFSGQYRSPVYLLIAAGLAMEWVETQGTDPVAILLEKHEYNKTRSYKHGGKRC